MNYLKIAKTQTNTCLNNNNNNDDNNNNNNNLPGQCSAKSALFLLHQMLSLMSTINPAYIQEIIIFQ